MASTTVPAKAMMIVASAILVGFGTLSPVTAQTRSAEPFRWEGRLATGSTLEIKGVNGPIRAVAGSGPTVRVEATRTARRSDPSQVEIVVLEHANGVTICAVYPSSVLRRNECRPGSAGNLGASNNDVQVAFTVELPAALAFTARTTNGAVSIEGLTGPVAAHTTNGNVRIDGGATAHARTTNGTVTLRSRGEVDARTTNGAISATLDGTAVGADLRTTNGGITLRLPANASAAVDARTSNGAIHSDLPVTVGTVSRNRLIGTLGAGGGTIELRTTNGSIRLERG